MGSAGQIIRVEKGMHLLRLLINGSKINIYKQRKVDFSSFGFNSIIDSSDCFTLTCDKIIIEMCLFCVERSRNIMTWNYNYT